MNYSNITKIILSIKLLIQNDDIIQKLILESGYKLVTKPKAVNS